MSSKAETVAIHPNVVKSQLLLVGYDVPITIIQRWNLDKRRDAAVWGAKQNLAEQAAAVGATLEVPPKPSWVNDKWKMEDDDGPF